MPKNTKITPEEAQALLARREAGATAKALAQETKRDPRTIRKHVEAARGSRELAAQRGRTAQAALAEHQEELRKLLRRLAAAVAAPEGLVAGREPLAGVEYGFEDRWRAEDAAKCGAVAYHGVGPDLEGAPPTLLEYGLMGPRGVALALVERDAGGPRRVMLGEEGGRLWRALRTHLTKRDPLWRQVEAWRRALLAEAQAVAELNRRIRERAEEAIGYRIVQWWEREPGRPCLYPSLAWWARGAIAHLARPEAPRYGDWELRAEEGGRLRAAYAHDVGEWLPDPAATRERLLALPPELAARAATEAALGQEAARREAARAALDTLEGLLLLHYAPGECDICLRIVSGR